MSGISLLAVVVVLGLCFLIMKKKSGGCCGMKHDADTKHDADKKETNSSSSEKDKGCCGHDH